MMPFNKMNPQQMVMTLMQKNMQGNPIFTNLMQLAQQGKTADIEQIARNICKENNLDFDKEFINFKQSFGL